LILLLEIKKQHVSTYHWPSSVLILKLFCKNIYTICAIAYWWWDLITHVFELDIAYSVVHEVLILLFLNFLISYFLIIPSVRIFSLCYWH